jgi:glycogen phosphorylase
MVRAALDLLNRCRIPADEIEPGDVPYELTEVRESCVFTTHTPVEAGHDRFSHELFERFLPDFVDMGGLLR